MRPHELNPLLLVCPWCGAVVGENCVTQTGKHTTYPHVARTRPLYEAWSAGYQSAEKYLIEISSADIEEAL